MNLRFAPILLLGSIVLTTGACATTLTGVDDPVRVRAPMSVEKDREVSTRYQDTECVSFTIVRRTKPVGLLCSSASMEMLFDLGFSTDSGDLASAFAMPHEEPVLSLATGMASYQLAPLIMNSHTLYEASVDCDEINGSVYRATSTCNVAVMPLGRGRFLYGNFVLENHASSSTALGKEEVLAIWRSLKVARY